MRIISGSHKGRRISAPKKLPVRPTTDMAKESLFNILNNRYYFEDLRVLDLFAGTGNIGYEFASRGASEVVSVDADPQCVKFIKQTAEQLSLNMMAVHTEATRFLEQASGQGFDVIFADPPYQQTQEFFEELVGLVFTHKRLNEEGVLVIEHSKHSDLSTLPYFNEVRKYGGSAFSFFGWQEK